MWLSELSQLERSNTRHCSAAGQQGTRRAGRVRIGNGGLGGGAEDARSGRRPRGPVPPLFLPRATPCFDRWLRLSLNSLITRTATTARRMRSPPRGARVFSRSAPAAWPGQRTAIRSTAGLSARGEAAAGRARWGHESSSWALTAYEPTPEVRFQVQV